MFTRNKIAAGVVLALSAVAPHALAANTAASTETTSSLEGLGAVTTYATAPAVLTLDQEYVVNDEVHVTLSQAALASDFPTTLACDMSGNGKAVGGNDTCTLTRFSNTTTVGKYRFTALIDKGTDGKPTVGATVTMPAVASMTHNSAATSATFHTQNSSGGIIDADVTTVVAAYDSDQFTVALTKPFNGIVDVDNSLKQYLAGNDSTTTDVAVYTITNDAIVTNEADIASIAVVLNGDFTWLDAGATAGAVDINAATHGSIELDTNAGGACTAMSAAIFNAAMTTATYACTVASGDSATEIITATFTVVPATGNAISARSYTADITTTFAPQSGANQTEATVAAGAIGAWTENTANVTAYSVPMSGSVTRMLWIANTGATDGAVTGTVEAGGVTYGPYALGTAAAKSNLAVGQTLDTALAADATWTTAAYTSRANITLSVGASSANVELSAGYYSTSDKDRQTLETSQKQ
jgi:hypothetical protein